MNRAAILVLGWALSCAAGDRTPRVRPPLWVDADSRPIPEPRKQYVSELHAIVNNSWMRHLSPAQHAAPAADPGALDVNSWDEAPDSSWFTNRIGRRALSFKETAASLEGEPPESGPWTVLRMDDEGYTPKLWVRDRAGRNYLFKLIERNAEAERISTLVFHAAGYNVPHNSLVAFRASDFVLDDGAYYVDPTGERQPMTPGYIEQTLAKLKPRADGRLRGSASLRVPGKDLGKFKYTGRRKDDPNDIIPHELRRELRGLRVIAAWLNHADTGDKNTFDAYVKSGNGGYVKHYLMDFGSTLGCGDFINGPYRVGHEYIFDGAAIGRSFVSLGLWRRPWEERGRIPYPEIGYYDAELFEPAQWKPNYPNLAFERMDAADAYWGAKIVSAFADDFIRELAQAGDYERPEAAAHLAAVMKARRDAAGRYWFDRVSPLEDFSVEDGRLMFRDLGIERGYVEKAGRRYEMSTGKGTLSAELPGIALPEIGESTHGAPDRYGRLPLARLWLRAKNAGGSWALPVEVVLGTAGGSAKIQVLGWTHAARWPR